MAEVTAGSSKIIRFSLTLNEKCLARSVTFIKRKEAIGRFLPFYWTIYFTFDCGISDLEGVIAAITFAPFS